MSGMCFRQGTTNRLTAEKDTISSQSYSLASSDLRKTLGLELNAKRNFIHEGG